MNHLKSVNHKCIVNHKLENSSVKVLKIISRHNIILLVRAPRFTKYLILKIKKILTIITRNQDYLAHLNYVLVFTGGTHCVEYDIKCCQCAGVNKSSIGQGLKFKRFNWFYCQINHIVEIHTHLHLRLAIQPHQKSHMIYKFSLYLPHTSKDDELVPRPAGSSQILLTTLWSHD